MPRLKIRSNLRGASQEKALHKNCCSTDLLDTFETVDQAKRGKGHFQRKRHSGILKIASSTGTFASKSVMRTIEFIPIISASISACMRNPPIFS